MAKLKDRIFTIGHNEYAHEISELLRRKALKKQLDAASRVEDGEIKRLKSKIFIAMAGHAVARCGDWLISLTAEKRNEGALTLHNGRKIPIADISAILMRDNGDIIPIAEIKTWFGGQTIGADLDITNTGENQ